jgi:hypothetical protein
MSLTPAITGFCGFHGRRSSVFWCSVLGVRFDPTDPSEHPTPKTEHLNAEPLSEGEPS